MVNKDVLLNFSKEEISSFKQTRQDYIDGKTTARDWHEIKKDLDNSFDDQKTDQSITH